MRTPGNRLYFKSVSRVRIPPCPSKRPRHQVAPPQTARYLPAPMPSRTPLLDDRALGRTLARMATEIVERGRGTDDLVLVGIQRRGVELADRLKRLIDQSEGSNVPSG